jgi:phospholipid-translocating ATPase
MNKLFQILSLCHTVQVDDSLAEKYQASSPDEFSFVSFCRKLGIVYMGEAKEKSATNPVRRVINPDGTETSYELLSIQEFDSTRKRMSVIVRDIQQNKIILMCKGAESTTFKCCTSGDIQGCDADIATFSQKGWRTLALAYKTLEEKDFLQISAQLTTALGDLQNRKQSLARVYDDIEQGMELIGATAIEDKLQDQVAETLEFIRSGGIKVWVLTGDKKETAINISNSCKHFSNLMIKLDLSGLKNIEQIESQLARAGLEY